MMEPLVSDAAIEVAECRSVVEPGKIDESRAEIEPALKGDLPIEVGENPLSPRGPRPFVPVAAAVRADAANGADQQADGVGIAGVSAVHFADAVGNDPVAASWADGRQPQEASPRPEKTSPAGASPLPLGSVIPEALPTEDASPNAPIANAEIANATIGGGFPAQLVSATASPQFGSDSSGVVLRSERPESWRSPEADPAPLVPPELPHRSIGVASPGPRMTSATACVAADALESIDPLPTPPETLLILDTETTALCPKEGQCIEVGAVLFQVPHRAVLTQVSFLLPCDRNPAETVNGIAAEVTRLPQPWPAALACFQAMLAQANAVLAHNASFDRQWFGRGQLPPIDLPWICSMEDIRWPSSLGLRPAPSVQALALAHGVPVWAAHRALTDCTYLVQVLQRCADLELLLATALEPRSLMRAEVSYADRHLAREAGFRWDQPVARAWTRRLSQREAISLPFPVHPVEESRHLGQAC